MTHKIALAFAAAASLVLFGPAAHAVPIPITFTVDENGNGFASGGPFGTSTPLTHSLAPDPALGGLNSLTYTLGEIPIIPGDLMMTESNPTLLGPAATVSDIVRFNTPGPSTLTFYSDTTPPVDSIADTGFPAITAVAVVLPEVGPEGNNGLIYTPMSGQPGFSFDPAFAITYDLVSDGTVPLPTALPLFATGIGGLGLLGWRRKRKAQARA